MQLYRDLRITDLQHIERITDRADLALDGVFEVSERSGFSGDDLFPVPLVGVDGMEIVHLFITADRIHIGIKTFTRGKTICVERHALPFCKRMYDDGISARFLHVKTNGTFHTAQVVVQSRFGVNEKRGGNTLQIEHEAKSFFKGTLEHTDGILCIIHTEGRLITLRHNYFTHKDKSSNVFTKIYYSIAPYPLFVKKISPLQKGMPGKNLLFST